MTDPIPQSRGSGTRRRFCLCERYSLLYVSNQKAGSSTIKLALHRAQADDPAYVPASIHAPQGSALALSRRDLNRRLETILTDNFVFTFVRNPLKRIVSVYFAKIRLGQKDGLFREKAGFAREQAPSFEDFIARLADTDPADFDPHWQLQTTNVGHGRIVFDRVGRLETFLPDWHAIAAATHLPDWLSEPEVPNSRAGRNHKGLAEWFADPATLERARRIYAADFAAFGYSTELPPGTG